MDTDVVIVGAGAAGLTAAYDLLRNPNHVLVQIVEASDRLGGRLQSLQGFADFPLDLGGEWIHGSPNLLKEIFNDDQKYDEIMNNNERIETFKYEPSYNVYVGNGDYETYSRVFTIDYKFVNYTWHQFFHNHVATDSVQDAIAYNCVVNSIDWTNTESVQVACADGRLFTTRKVIVTVSVKMLQDNVISFAPPLPDRYGDALSRMEMLDGMKVFLKFQSSFFPYTFVLEPNPRENNERLFYDVTLGQNTNDDVLGVFLIGRQAAKYIDLDDDTIIQLLLNDLDAVYNNQASANFIDGVVQNWSKEPHVRGAYSYLPRDDPVEPIYILKTPVQDTLYFAGEATYFDYGYAHGAAFSGREAATRVLDSLPGTNPPPSSGRSSLACFCTWRSLFYLLLASICSR